MLVAYNNILAFIESLEKKSQRSYKDCNGCEYNRTVKDQIGWTFRGCFGGNYQGKPIAEIELCPLKLNRWKEQQADETLMEKDKIDTAFTKMMEKEQPQGLDEAADNYGREYCCEWWGGHSWVDDSEMLSLAFKAGAEWQREQIGIVNELLAQQGIAVIDSVDNHAGYQVINTIRFVGEEKPRPLLCKYYHVWLQRAKEEQL